MGQAFGCIQVDESTAVVKETYGKLGVLETGCHCLPWCLGHRVAGKVSLRVQQLDVRCEAKTKDNAFVNVVASIQYCVIKDKVSDAFKNFSDAKGQIQVKGLIQANVSNAIREGISKRNWDSAFEEKNDIAKYLKEELEKSMSAYGFKIVQIHIEPDITVKKAMNEIIAETIKKAAENKGKAEAEKISQIKRAEAKAEAEKILAKGEGEGEGEVGLGIVRQDQTDVDGLRDGVLASSENVPRTSAKDNMGGLVQ